MDIRSVRFNELEIDDIIVVSYNGGGRLAKILAINKNKKSIKIETYGVGIGWKEDEKEYKLADNINETFIWVGKYDEKKDNNLSFINQQENDETPLHVFFVKNFSKEIN